MRIAYERKSFAASTLSVIAQASEIIEAYLAQGYSLTLRQLYYRFVAAALIPNTQRDYKRLGSIINDGRLAGLIDWSAIEDRTRELKSLSHWESPGEIVEACAKQFRFDKWENQRYRPEVWIEKDALVGVIKPVCDRLDVPFFSCRGYVSQSEIWRAGRRMLEFRDDDQTPIVIHLGDHDPSGLDMTRDIRERLAMFSEGRVKVKRIALNMNQIEELGPPPNPAKVTDSRAVGYIARYGRDSWELDALEPSYIVALIESAVGDLRDDGQWIADVKRETEARDKLARVARDLEEGAIE